MKHPKPAAKATPKPIPMVVAVDDAIDSMAICEQNICRRRPDLRGKCCRCVAGLLPKMLPIKLLMLRRVAVLEVAGDV